jgi:hypothetical protein
MRPMFSPTRSIVFGFLKLEIKSSHSISMILSWLDKCVSIALTLEFKISMGASHSGNPGEDLAHDIVLGHFAFDVAKSYVTEGLNFKLGSLFQHNIQDTKLKLPHQAGQNVDALRRTGRGCCRHRLFADVIRARVDTLRFEGGERDCVRAAVEE